MTEIIKLIRQLPELKNHEEWACEQGCDHITPKLTENLYSQTWDNDGNLLDKKSEFYYTCQKKHTLMVWDNEKNDYSIQDDEYYQEVINRFGSTLEGVNEVIQELEERVSNIDLDECREIGIRSVTAFLTCTLKTGEELEFSLPFLKALRDQLELVENTNYNVDAPF